MDAQQITAIVIAALITGGVSVGALAQAWATRRQGSRPSRRLDALEQRLERMEQAIDTIAVEVERVGEAHRFTARLLGEQRQAAAAPPPPAPQRPEGVITPH